MYEAMLNERLDGLLAYLDRLTALEIAGYMCSREITECIDEYRLWSGISSGVEFNREAEFNVVLASKTEGAPFEEWAAIHVKKGVSIKRTIDELRTVGFRIFTVNRGVGMVDDFVKGGIIQ